MYQWVAGQCPHDLPSNLFGARDVGRSRIGHSTYHAGRKRNSQEAPRLYRERIECQRTLKQVNLLGIFVA
jgi:hypothetical protein